MAKHRKPQPRMPKDWRPPAYVPKLLEQASPFLQPGTVTNWLVRHDDYCAHWRGRPCNCDPDVDAIGHSGPYGLGSGRN